MPDRHPSAVVVPLRPGDGPPDGAPVLPPTRTRIKKLRLLALLTGLGVLGVVSAVFGALMAVASDLPALENLSVPTRNSVIEDRTGKRLGLLTGTEKRILLEEDEIAPVMEHAIIAIEDRRFYSNPGVDFRSTGRALYQDLVAGKAVQGGSTIPQQFVKNATDAQDERTVSNKVREAALAFHVKRKWPPRKILRNYLNTIYFGNGAYGLEAAARTYFAWNHPDCTEDGQPRCAEQLEPAEAALIAGVVASPSGYDPLARPRAAKERRDLVLLRMRQQGYLDRAEYDRAVATPLPNRDQVAPPQEETTFPYFTSWVKQQVVDELGGGRVGARRAFEGSLKIRTTIDSKLQEAAQDSVNKWLTPGDGSGPEAAMVVLDNATGEVRAMVGGRNDQYAERPFNLATQGQRQPGSAFKPFVLAEALTEGISPGSTWSSRKTVIDVPNSSEKFEVNNYEDAYAGSTTLARATTFSDNAVYAQVGIKVGTREIARLSRRMGIRTPVSPNYAMTLGGLREGVTPLDLAHAYHTIASGGKLVYGSMSPDAGRFKGGITNLPGPPAIDSISRRRGSEEERKRVIRLPDGTKARNRRRERRVLREDVAAQVRSILATVVKSGTGTRAALPDGQFAAGKTGTTEAYSDAWFVGFNKRYTVAVWVGYPEGFKSMETEWKGDPVAGGTYPAAIWRDFMLAAAEARPSAADKKRAEDDADGAVDPAAPAPAPGGTAPAAPAPAPEAPAPGPEEPSAPAPAPVAPEPEAPPPAPAPAPAEPAPVAPAAPQGGAAPSGAG